MILFCVEAEGRVIIGYPKREIAEDYADYFKWLFSMDTKVVEYKLVREIEEHVGLNITP